MPYPVGTFKARFDKAMKEFANLEGVDNDSARIDCISDLVFITQFEIDLVEAGESEIDVRPHRKFVKKWSRVYDEPDGSRRMS